MQLFASNGIVVNLMRNTATKAIFCIDNDRIIVPKVIRELETTFHGRASGKGRALNDTPLF